MEPVQRLLFGRFPREGANPSRFSLFTPAHFDRFVRKANSRSNVYCSISHMPASGVSCDKVFFDLDSKNDSLDDLAEPEQFSLMRSDPNLADEVLGNVVEDMQKLARASREDGIPAIGVFSGKGVHFHQLYQPERSPKRKMESIARKYDRELGLKTSDTVVYGDVVRICKIPNTHRWDDDRRCDVVTVPLTSSEMEQLDAEGLLELSQGVRDVHPPISLYNRSERPEMELFEEYLTTPPVEDLDEIGEKEVGPMADADKDVEEIVREFIELPCMVERVLSSSPDHLIRWNFAVLMFNYGFSKAEVHDMIRRLGWEDYDPEMTQKQLESIWRNRYRDKSCRQLMLEDLCVRTEDPESCPAYGWTGGNDNYGPGLL